MRFTRPVPVCLSTREGETRIRRKFLLLPRTFQDGPVYVTQWLCFAHIMEQLQSYTMWNGAEPCGTGYHWVETGFAPNPSPLHDGSETPATTTPATTTSMMGDT